MTTNIMTLNHDGKELNLDQEPYIDTVCLRGVGDTVAVIDGTVYRASAVDGDGNQYQLYWTELVETADGPEVANWDVVVVLPL